MRKVLSSGTVTADDGTVLEVTAYGEETEAGAPSASNRRQFGLSITFPGETTARTMNINAAGAELIGRTALEAAVLIETQADVARRYLRHPEALSPEAITELERMAGETNE